MQFKEFVNSGHVGMARMPVSRTSCAGLLELLEPVSQTLWSSMAVTSGTRTTLNCYAGSWSSRASRTLLVQGFEGLAVKDTEVGPEP